MIITTTPTIEGKQIVEYKGLVFGEVVSGANFIRDFLAGITDIIGGRSGAYESKLNGARKEALAELAKEAQKVGQMRWLAFLWSINQWAAIKECSSW